MKYPLNDLLSAVATAITGVSGWRQSTLPYELFPDQTAQTVPDKTFSIGVPRTQWAGPEEHPRRRPDNQGGLVNTELRVRWVCRLRADNAARDYGLSFEEEDRIVSAVLAISERPVHIWADNASRRVSPTGTWIEGDITFVAQHRL